MNSRMTMPEAPAGEIDDGAEIAGNVSVRVVSEFTPPAVTPQAWNSLVAASDAPVYLTFEWQSLWWRHFGSGRRLNIVMFTSGGKLVGAAPLFSGRGIMQEPGVLRLIGSGDAYTRSGGLFLDDGPSDYLDILIDPEFGQAVGRAFADYLHRNRGSIARVDLVNLRPGGPAATFVVPALRSRGFAVKESPGDLCPSIEVRARTEEFVRGLAPGVRRRMNQALKLADGPGSPVVLSENDPGGWERFYEDLVTLHQRRWNAAGFPGLFHDSRSAAFQRSVAGEFRRNGWLWYASLSEAGRCVAARLAFSFRGRMYDYLSGFDETAPCARRRPGMTLLLAMHGAAHASGLRTLDMLRGDEKYKFELTDRSERLANVTVAVGDAGRAKPPVRARILSSLGLAAFLARREMRLFGVQIRHHGAARGLASYLRFRGARYKRKFFSGTPGGGPDRGAQGERSGDRV